MTFDEILERHGLAADDYTLIGYNQEWYEEGNAISKSGWLDGDVDYAFVIHEDEHLLNSVLAHGTKTIAYYPDPGMYLVKRKVSKKDTMTITATMDYRFGWNNYGFVGEYKNFKLECK